MQHRAPVDPSGAACAGTTHDLTRRVSSFKARGTMILRLLESGRMAVGTRMLEVLAIQIVFGKLRHPPAALAF